MNIREMTEQYRAEAENIAGIISRLLASAGSDKTGRIDSELEKRVNILAAMRRENLATYKHLRDYCETVEGRIAH